jgi:hypothetical protein
MEPCATRKGRRLRPARTQLEAWPHKIAIVWHFPAEVIVWHLPAEVRLTPPAGIERDD